MDDHSIIEKMRSNVKCPFWDTKKLMLRSSTSCPQKHEN